MLCAMYLEASHLTTLTTLTTLTFSCCHDGLLTPWWILSSHLFASVVHQSEIAWEIELVTTRVQSGKSFHIGIAD